jgi:hypothetical protein
MTIQLFKIITNRDEVVVGVSPADATSIGNDAATIGRTLVTERSLGFTQYAVRRAADGSLEQAPLREIAILAYDSLRIEPYVSPLPVVG